MGIKSDLLKSVVSKKKAAKTEYEKAHAIAQRNASLPVEQGGLGLPADNTAMDRARAMGFDKDVYHGSYSDITNIDPEKFSNRVDYMKGFFTADNPEIAGNYGDVVYPLKQSRGIQVSDRRTARREGREVPELDTVFDPSRGVNVTNNPSNIRSVNAAFDPLKRNSSNILASAGAGAAVAGGSLYTPEENQAQAGWINKGGKQVLETWHGTPHEFPPTANNPLGEYDLSKIGTGEGAQAYGHGIYQADVKDVAKGYKDGLSSNRLYDKQGNEFDTQAKLSHPNIRATLSKSDGDIDAAIAKAKDVISGNESGSMPYEYALKDLAILEETKQSGGIGRKQGSLYRTHSDIQPEEMLDWDKPLSEQSDAIKELANKLDLTADYDDGENLYRVLGSIHGGDNEATNYLNSLGIKGIQYSDKLSRGTDGGTKNYVIFDPSRMNIVEKGATTAQGMGTLAALSGGTAAIYNAAKNDKLGEAANYAQDAANMIGYIPSGGLLTTSDIVGGIAKAGAAATGNLDAYNENLAPYVERAGETKSGLGKAVEGVIGYGMDKVTPYAAEAAAPIVSNVQGQWQRIEDTPGDANLFGFAQELKRKADAKLFKSQAQIDAFNAKRNARRTRKLNQ